MGAPTWANMLEEENLFSAGDLLDLRTYALQSQYSASPHILSLCRSFQARLDASAEVDLIFSDIVNIKTASGTALETWGVILDMPRTLAAEGTQIIWPDETYRFLLLYKALANISAADVKTQVELLTKLFDKRVRVLDNQDMTIRAVCEFFPSAEEIAVLKNYGLLTRGAGVGWELYCIIPAESFGFEGSGLLPFNQAPFAPYGTEVQ